MLNFPDIETIHPPTSPRLPDFINELHKSQTTDFIKTQINTVYAIIPIELRKLLVNYKKKYSMDFMVYLPENNHFCEWRYLICCRHENFGDNFLWIFDNESAISGLKEHEKEISCNQQKKS